MPNLETEPPITLEQLKGLATFYPHFLANAPESSRVQAERAETLITAGPRDLDQLTTQFIKAAYDLG